MEHHNAGQKKNPWTLAVDAALAYFDTTLQGLSEAEARQRLESLVPTGSRKNRRARSG